MLIKTRSHSLPEHQVTDESVYLARRTLLKGLLSAAAAPLALGAAPGLAAERERLVAGSSERAPAWLKGRLQGAVPGDYSTDETPTPYEYVTQYNNFYEFGMGKGDPAENSKDFRTDPWQVKVDGEAGKTGTFNLEDLVVPHQLEERIYRLRCVEAWSMVVPWVGIPLATILKRFEPTGNARFVRFETLVDPDQMPGQRSFFRSIDYPYIEGLRMDEAMHPLAFIAVGLYGNSLPPQNGAPLRLVVPWKYGFKSIKSIVRISFLERQPKTTWEISNSREYGFYANVNPEVDHPRWSQATERRLPGGLFSSNRIATLPFNGYADEVAGLYQGMNLRKYF